MASSALAICSRNSSAISGTIAGCKVLHGDVGVIVSDAQIVDLHDVFMLQARDDFVFLQESIEADEALGNVRHLTEDLEHHQSPGAFALGQIDLAHAAAADLPNAPVPADHHRTEAIATIVV